MVNACVLLRFAVIKCNAHRLNSVKKYEKLMEEVGGGREGIQPFRGLQ